MFPVLSSNGPSGYTIANSLRFQSASSQYLNRTPLSSGNLQKFTWSGWVKRGTLGVRQIIFASANPVVNTTSQQEFQFVFTSSDQLEIAGGISGVSSALDLITTPVYRDPSAWYHIVLSVDTTQATASNRIILYVNGVQVTAFGTANYPSQNYNTCVDLIAFSHRMGGSGTAYLDGYLAEVNFIDGQALTPSSFGSTDATSGQWIAKKYTGTYGTNGFYLPFSNGTSTTTLGADSSGNGNNWTLTNFTRSAGVSDCWMYDVPSGNGGASGTQPNSNYAVMNPINTYSTVPTAANLSLSVANLTGGGIAGTMATPTTGKWYWEVTANLTSGGTNTNGPYIGIMPSTVSPRNGGTNWYTGTGSYYYVGDGGKVIANVYSAYGSTWTDSTANTYVIGIAYDADAGTLVCYRNNTSQGTLASSIPATGYYPVSGNAQGSAGACSIIYNFGQRSFAYTPPTGFKALCTANLPVATIKQGNKYMDATTYSGNGTSQTITNAGGFKPDLVWIKSRSTTYNNNLQDSVRGAGKSLLSNLTNAEFGNSGDLLTSFNSNGFTVNNTLLGGSDPTTDGSGQTFVGWQWQAGQGTTSSNTNGSITSTVSVNATAGFSVVTYTGTGANATVGHGLGVAPAMIITKQRNSTGWWGVYNKNLSAGYVLILQNTNAAASDSTYYTTTAPTSSVFFVGTSTATNGSASTYVSYCFAEIVGFSKFGSYTGNGSADGPFVYCGFQPKFVLIKKSSATSNWIIWDSSRNTYNVLGERLYPDLSAAGSFTADLDFLSNGFKYRQSGGANDAGGTYIFMAFATNPFQNSNAF